VRVVATAGHVDHGKSTLVHALTGIDPDRFEEEKRRGLTIDLGFAWTTLPSGAGIAFVDVPGHVRFLKNMLAGVGAVDACLFVVDAVEGWKPQSEEHLRILELVGIEAGVVALTKVGLVDADDAELAGLDVADHLRGTPLETAEIVAIDTPTGVGLGQLRLALDRLVTATSGAADHGRARLWVDRSFAATGAGTVVTGTLTGGSLHVDDQLVVVGPTTGGVPRPVRVRSLQTLGQAVATVGPGNRVAVNLTGVDHGTVARGDALVAPGDWYLTSTFDAELRVLDHLDHEVTRRGAYLAYVGAGEHAAALRLLGGATSIAPGGRGLVRLRLPAALPVLPGDRYVLRESGRSETVGGGEVLDVAPVLPARRARPDRTVERVVAERGWVGVDELALLTGERVTPTAGRWVVDPAVWVAACARVRDEVAAAGPLGLTLATLDERDRAALEALDDVDVAGGRAVIRGTADPLAGHPFVRAVAAAPFAPPAPGADVDRAEVRELVRRGALVEQDGVLFAPSAIDAAARVVAGLLAAQPEGVTVAEVREALGTSRKYALPLLNRLDATGVTRRRGDVRIGGPRLPPPG
jgi:selenocysteine-specific elongation factor